jgi:DNA-binding LacI/PurR family transcriptional regulator
VSDVTQKNKLPRKSQTIVIDSLSKVKKNAQVYGATSYDVAARAGVSQSAVSRCFKIGASVAPKTRERITKAARDLGYQPNALAASLRERTSNVVAVLISNLTNLYYPEVLAELSQKLSDRGIRVLLFALRNESEIDTTLNQVWRHRVDGVIAAVRLSDNQIDMFKDRGVSLVLYNRISESQPVSAVCCDSETGVRLLIDKLLASGHQHFAIIAGPPDSYVGQIRVQAARSRLLQAGLFDIALSHGDYSYESGGFAFRSLRAQCDKLDALICANDLMAIGAMDMARHEFGLIIPDQLSIVGFDGVDPVKWSSYGLTSIRQPVQRMAQATVSMLMESIENPDLEPESRLFSGRLITGRSARLGIA